MSLPAFGSSYSDTEIAAAANHVARRFGSAASKLTAKGGRRATEPECPLIDLRKAEMRIRSPVSTGTGRQARQGSTRERASALGHGKRLGKRDSRATSKLEPPVRIDDGQLSRCRASPLCSNSRHSQANVATSAECRKRTHASQQTPVRPFLAVSFAYLGCVTVTVRARALGRPCP